MKRTEKTGFQKKQTEPMGDVQIQEFLDMIAPAVIKFETDHFICGNTYRCVWALREYPTATEEQAILSHLGEKDVCLQKALLVTRNKISLKIH